MAKVTEICDQICSMATAIKEAAIKELAVNMTLAKAATLEKVHTVERRLNFENEMLGTQAGFSYTDYDGNLRTVNLEQFPDPARETTPSS